jgi:hypothetical protein
MAIPSPVLADTLKTSIPGRTAWMLRLAAAPVFRQNLIRLVVDGGFLASGVNQ